MVSTPKDPTFIPIDLDTHSRRISGYTAHKNLYFDVPLISHITGNLYQGGVGPGLDLPEGITHLVSLYPWEHYNPSSSLRSSLTVLMYDSLNQGFSQVAPLAQWVNSCAKDGPTLVHCQAGLNRSALVVARALMFQGLSAPEAISLLRSTRDEAVLCNSSFEEWLLAQDQDPGGGR